MALFTQSKLVKNYSIDWSQIELRCLIMANSGTNYCGGAKTGRFTKQTLNFKELPKKGI